VDYHFSVADQGKTNFRFPFPFAVNRRKFAVSVSVCSKQTEVCRFLFRLQQIELCNSCFCLQQTNGVCRFRFRLQQTNASLLFPFAADKRKFALSFFVCSKQMEVAVFS
jgi:hypothetical protein